MLSAINPDQSITNRFQQQPQTSQHPQRARPSQQAQRNSACTFLCHKCHHAKEVLFRSNVGLGALGATGVALAFAALPLSSAVFVGSGIAGVSLKILADRTPEKIVRTYIHAHPRIELNKLKEIIQQITTKSYTNIELLFELITEFAKRKEIEHVKYLISKFPDEKNRDFFVPVNLSQEEIAQIENLATASLETLMPYYDNMSLDEEIRHIKEIGEMHRRKFLNKHISTTRLAVKSMNFHVANQNLDRAWGLYKEFIDYIRGSQDPTTKLFLETLFNYQKQLKSALESEIRNIFCKGTLKVMCDYVYGYDYVCDYVMEPLEDFDPLIPLAPIFVAVKKINNGVDCDHFWKLGAEWSLSLSPPQVEWASFARSKIDNWPDFESELDEKISKAREKLRAAAAIKKTNGDQ